MKTNSTHTTRSQQTGPPSLSRAGVMRLTIVLITLAAFFIGCGNQDEPDGPSLTLSPPPGTLTFSAEPTESYTFKVSTINTTEWSAESDQDWCKITTDTKASTFTVTARPNLMATAPPPAKIVVKAAGSFVTVITATQAAGKVEYDLYISGYYTHETEGSIACYWKNGVRTDLPKPTGIQASSVAMDIDNGSVYIAGEAGSSACYWKDGEFIHLANPGTEGGSASNYTPISMAADNGVVHVISREYYWSGSEQPRKYNAQGFEGSGIDASNGIYCLVGTLHLSIGNIGSTAASQTNGTALSLGVKGNVKDIRATCVTLADGTAYVGGYYFDKTANRLRACYWNDGTCTPADAPQGITDMAVRAICVENGKVYLAGHCFTGEGVDVKPYYWVDGECIALNLPGQTTEACAEDMTVLNGNIYIAGYYKDAQSGRYHACYWVNGKRFDIPEEEGMRDLSATGIALVKK